MELISFKTYGKLIAPFIRVKILYPICCIVILNANIKERHTVPKF